MASGQDNAITEEIIKRRLLIDGDGMGDDRKLTSLIKLYMSFLESEKPGDTDSDAMERLVAQIKSMDFIARRTCHSIIMNENGQEVYVDLEGKVQKEIVETKRQLEESKALLEEATKHRKYSMEYDALGKLIDSKPDRKMTELKRMGLTIELDTLRKRQEKVDDQMDSRRRSVSMLTSTIQILREQLEKEEASILKGNKDARKRAMALDADSNSQSGHSSPSPVPMEAQEATKEHVEPPERRNGTASSTPSSSNEKGKSEKYEDLSESDGDDNS